MTTLNKTFLPNKLYKNRNWFIIDCKGQKLGRLSTFIVSLLIGKIKPHYHPAIDTGDFIILINAKEIIVNKDKQYYIVNKPGRPGRALKIRTTINLVPQLILERSIKGMLSKAKTKTLLRRLNIYSNSNHPHLAQKPITIDLLKI